MKAFASGVRASGDEVVDAVSATTDHSQMDAFLTWNGLKNQMKPIADAYKAAGKKVVILETPLMNRDVDPRDYASGRLGINHIVYSYGDFNIPESAGPERFEKLGIELLPWRKKGDHIVIAMQLSDDTSICGVDFFAWIENCIKQLREHTSRPIVLKSHPMIESNLNHPVRAMEAARLQDMSTRLNFEIFKSNLDDSRFDLLDNCWAVVCLTTGLAIDCVIRGIPVIATHPGNFMYPIQSNEILEIENPRMGDRQPWFNRLAYAQWSIEEAESGVAWRHIKQAI